MNRIWRSQFPVPSVAQGIIPSYGLELKSEQRWGAIVANAYFNGEELGPGIKEQLAGQPTRIGCIYNYITLSGLFK